jgi:hypothetical protein
MSLEVISKIRGCCDEGGGAAFITTRAFLR